MATLTSQQVLAAASETLVAQGFRLVNDSEDDAGSAVRVFEDALSIVGVAVYETWSALEDRWPAAQSELVDLISAHLSRSEPKSWEGYLMLMTPDDSPDDQLTVDRIRRDTGRLRKLVATGSDLATLASVGDALLPVLPLHLDVALFESESVIDRLPVLLEEHGVSIELSQSVLGAFEENRSPLEGIWNWRRQQSEA